MLTSFMCVERVLGAVWVPSPQGQVLAVQAVLVVSL